VLEGGLVPAARKGRALITLHKRGRPSYDAWTVGTVTSLNE
jgi:hypothetical protein